MAKYLSLHAYVRLKRPLLSYIQKRNHVKIARWHRQTNADGLKNKKWLFSDEKKFELNGGLNQQNDRVDGS